MSCRRRIGAAIGCAYLLVAAPAVVQAQPAPRAACAGRPPARLPTPQPSRSLRFGIFPGGSAGVTAGPRPAAKPEVQRKIDLRLAELRGRRPFVVRLYTEYVDPSTREAALREAEAKTRHYTRAGFLVEWVLRYRPRAAADVAGYARFVRKAVRRVGGVRGVRSIQVGNEVNLPFSPDAADGSYPRARAALIAGVLAAKAQAHSRRATARLEIGLNWAYLNLATDPEFFRDLRRRGGRRLVRAVDFVGADVYPGTFAPAPSVPLRTGTVTALAALRKCLLPLAGIPPKVPIHVTENGWPTGPGRSPFRQRAALRGMLGAVNDYRGRFNVTDYRWFDLRDADSSATDFQEQFGLTRDDYTPKPAFAAYRKLVAHLGT